MHEKNRLIVQTNIEKEVEKANLKIKELESVTHVVSPESTLGDVMTFEENYEEENLQRELKRTYMRKRKLLFFKEHLDDMSFFLCHSCGNPIELERLLIMPKAGLCDTCANAA